MIDNIESMDDIISLLKAGHSEWGTFGNVNVKQDGDLFLFSYSAKAAYEKTWNYFEVVSRGLIVNGVTGEIVARPFDKFFNWGEGDRITTSPIKTITEKMDGSLGIVYRNTVSHGHYRIATRGSFASEQATWANDFLEDNYSLHRLPDELTLLLEIIYPDNRIVVDYKHREDLVLLAARNRHTGDYVSHDRVVEIANKYGFSLPSVYTFVELDEMINSMDEFDANNEGYVVEFEDGQRFKFKGQRYIELHRAISSLTFKNVLREMQNGTVEDFIECVPDEFLDDVRGWIKYIRHTLVSVTFTVNTVFNVAPKDNRKTFAKWVIANHSELSSYLFAMLDRRDIEPIIYKRYDWSKIEEAGK